MVQLAASLPSCLSSPAAQLCIYLGIHGVHVGCVQPDASMQCVHMQAFRSMLCTTPQPCSAAAATARWGCLNALGGAACDVICGAEKQVLCCNMFACHVLVSNTAHVWMAQWGLYNMLASLCLHTLGQPLLLCIIHEGVLCVLSSVSVSGRCFHQLQHHSNADPILLHSSVASASLAAVSPTILHPAVFHLLPVYAADYDVAYPS
jgi:hypothetical protein